MRLNGLLLQVGEHGIGAAERHHRQLAEQHADIGQHMAAPEDGERNGQRCEPEHTPYDGGAESAACGCFVDADRWRKDRSAARAHQPEQPSGDHHERKRNTEQIEGHEGEPGDPEIEACLQGALADFHERFDDERQNGGFDAKEQRGDQWGLCMKHVEPRQTKDHECAGNDEQRARDEAAAHAMQQPAYIGGELLRLWAGQKHAIVQCMQITRLIDPFFLLDKDAVHERDLAGRAAKAQASDLEAGGDKLRESGTRSCDCSFRDRGVTQGRVSVITPLAV